MRAVLTAVITKVIIFARSRLARICCRCTVGEVGVIQLVPRINDADRVRDGCRQGRPVILARDASIETRLITKDIFDPPGNILGEGTARIFVIDSGTANVACHVARFVDFNCIRGIIRIILFFE